MIKKKKLVDTTIFTSIKYKTWLIEERKKIEERRRQEIETELKMTGLRAHLFCEYKKIS
jgi:hypothetical protein